MKIVQYINFDLFETSVLFTGTNNVYIKFGRIDGIDRFYLWNTDLHDVESTPSAEFVKDLVFGPDIADFAGMVNIPQSYLTEWGVTLSSTSLYDGTSQDNGEEDTTTSSSTMSIGGLVAIALLLGAIK